MDIVIRLAADIAAVNSAGMVNKIRFVAVALLDILSEADPEQSMNMVAGLDNPQTANVRREAAMTHLGKYPSTHTALMAGRVAGKTMGLTIHCSAGVRCSIED